MDIDMDTDTDIWRYHVDTDVDMDPRYVVADTNGAAAEVMKFDRSGKKVRPGTSGRIKVDQREYPKGPPVKKHKIRSDLISADPIRPFQSSLRHQAQGHDQEAGADVHDLYTYEKFTRLARD